MKRSICVLSLVFYSFLFSQPVYVDLSEERNSGKQESISASGPAIVDINSTIKVKIRTADVEEAMLLYQGIPSSASGLKTLRTLNEVLLSEKDIMDLLNEDIVTGNKGKLAGLKSDLYEHIEQNDSVLYEELNSPRVDELSREFTKDGKPHIAFVIHYLNEKADSMRQSFLEEMGLDIGRDSSQLVFFRLGAFLKNRNGGRAIHVENFDEIDKGPYAKRKSFFGKPLGEEETAALKQNQILADSLQASFLQSELSLAEGLKIKANNLFPSRDAFKQLREDLTLAVKEIKNTPKEEKEEGENPKESAIVSRLAQLELDDIRSYYESMTSAYEKINVDFGQQEPIDTEILLNLLSQIKSRVEKSYSSFQLTKKEADNADQKYPRMDTVAQSFDAFKTAVIKDVSTLRGVLTRMNAVLSVFKRPSLDTEKFSKKVKRFTIGDIPETGYIELRYIGERKSGDELLIKAVLEKGNEDDPEQKEIYRRYVCH